jgi:hypothetical protein
MTDDTSNLILTRLDQLRNDIVSFKSELSECMGRLENQMTTLEIRMNGLENNQSALHADMTYVNQRLDNIGTRANVSSAGWI